MFGVYGSIWRYAVVKDFIGIFLALSVGSAVSYILLNLFGQMPSNIYMVLAFLIAMCTFIGLRLVYQYLYAALNRHMSTNL